MPLLKYDPAIAEIIYQPPCPTCDGKMTLVRIDPVAEATDRRTFECSKCNHTVVAEVQFK